MSFWRSLRELIGGSPPEPEPLRVLIPRPDFESTVHEKLSTALAERGFHPSRKDRWSRVNEPEILALVELEPLKAAFSAAWGVSLAFVPHLEQKKGFRVEWHRAEKSARFDLSYNPLDYERDLGPWCLDQLSRPETFVQETESFAERIAENATRFVEPLQSPEAVLAALEAKRERPSIRLSFEHYPQEVLAYAFLLARCGRRQEADNALRLFVDSMKQFDDCKDLPEAPIAELAELLRKV